MLGVSGIMNEETVKKGLQKIEPRFKKFFSESEKYGYPLGAAIGFLKSDLAKGNEPVDKSLRPDQSANIQLQRQENSPERFGGAALKAGAGALAGGLSGAALSGLGNLFSSNQPSKEETTVSPQKLSSQIQPNSREEAVRQYNTMQKDKRLMDQLREDFSNRYGEQTNDPDMQALLQALQQLNQARGG